MKNCACLVCSPRGIRRDDGERLRNTDPDSPGERTCGRCHNGGTERPANPRSDPCSRYRRREQQDNDQWKSWTKNDYYRDYCAAERKHKTCYSPS
jgi:hypothetical protein